MLLPGHGAGQDLQPEVRPGAQPTRQDPHIRLQGEEQGEVPGQSLHKEDNR